MDKKFDPNAPAFGEDAQKIEVADVTPTEEVEVKPKVEETKEETEEESKVPYSRFKKFHDAAKDAEERAAYWEQKAKEQEERPAQVTVTDDLPPQWVKLYGDGEASKNAWEVQKQMNADILKQAREEAQASVRNERQMETQRLEANEAKLDEDIEDLEAYVGRKLTAAEESALWDIVDDYTPKDRQGNYAGEIIPLDKAWEIYELKAQANKAPRNASRNNVAAITGGKSQGETTIQTEQNKNFNPLDWNAWKQRL